MLPTLHTMVWDSRTLSCTIFNRSDAAPFFHLFPIIDANFLLALVILNCYGQIYRHLISNTLIAPLMYPCT